MYPLVCFLYCQLIINIHKSDGRASYLQNERLEHSPEEVRRPISLPHINFSCTQKNADNEITNKIFTLNLDKVFGLL